MSAARRPAVAEGALLLRRLLSSRAGWAVLAAVAAAALAIGSVHPAAPTRAARIAALESEIKCPSCADLSIGQSDVAAAADLRAQVTRMVDAGASDAAVKARVVAEYGSAVLEVPSGSGTGTLVFALPAACLALLAACLALFLWRRRRGPPGPAATSADDEALVAGARRRATAGERR